MKYLMELPLEYSPLRIESLLLQLSKLIIEGVKLDTQGCYESKAHQRCFR